MAYRLARAYLILLFSLDVLLFSCALILHLHELLRSRGSDPERASFLFRATAIVGVLAMPFVKDSLRWVEQVRRTPRWMGKTALFLGVYAMVITILQAIFPQGSSFADQTVTISGVPLGFDAISICILWPVLWRGYLDRSQIVKRAGSSIAIILVILVAFWTYHAGYWPPHSPQS